MNLSFRKPTADELDVIYSMYEVAIKHMESNNIFQWDMIYPDKAILAEDMQKSELVIGILDNEIAVAFVLNQECDDQYLNGIWKHFLLCGTPAMRESRVSKKRNRYSDNVLYRQ